MAAIFISIGVAPITQLRTLMNSLGTLALLNWPLVFRFAVKNTKALIDYTTNKHQITVCLFVFVALHPKSTAMVIAGRSVHLTTLFPGQA